MKRVISVVGLASLMVLTACGGNQEMYRNTGSFIDGKITISIGGFWEFESLGRYSLSFNVHFLSTNPKPVEISVKSAKIYREKDKAEYNSGLIYLDPLKLECDIKNSLSFSTYLPTSTTEDNYKLVLKYNSKTLVYHFYDKASAGTSYSGASASTKI